MDRFRALEAFVIIAETGNMTRAARALDVSKSLVSDRLAALEHLVGERLVARTTRHLSLTDAGRALYDEYAPVVGQLAKLEIRRYKGSTLSGRLRVVAMIDVGMHEISGALLDLQREHLGLETELVLSNEIVDPRVDGFDIAFHFRRGRMPTLSQETVATIDCGLFAAPSYLDDRSVPLHPEDLTQHTCLGYSFQAGVDDWNTSQWLFSRNGEKLSIRVPLIARANSSGVLKLAIEDGRGLAVLPVLRTGSAVTEGRLVRLLPDWVPPRLTLTAVYARAPRGRSAARELVSAVRRRLSLHDDQGMAFK